MRRSGYVCLLLAAFLLSSRPDAAFVPFPRTPDNASAQRTDNIAKKRPPSAARTAAVPAARTSAPTMMLTPRASAPVLAAVPKAMPMAAPMQPPAGRTATSTALGVTPNPAGLAAAVTLTATVSVVPPASGTPTGLVRFRSNGVVIGSAPVAPSGLAVFTTAFAVAASVNLTASYAGDTTFAPSTSDPVPHLTTAAGNSTLTAVVTAPTPSAVGAPFNVYAIVFPLGAGAPTGLVQFRDNGTPIGSAALSSASGLHFAFVTLNPGAAGTRTFTAHYGGDAIFAGSVSPPAVHTVYGGAAPSATTTALAAAPATSLVGQPITLTATVTRTAGGVAAGTVDFFAHGALLGSQALAAGGGAAQATLTVSTLPKGIALLTAAYRGNAASAASATPIPVFQCVDCVAPNATPLAEAGAIQAVTPGAVVQLDGTASSDVEGGPLTYTWTNVTTAPFTPATLSNATSARPTFVATVPEAIYAFDLVVSDGTLSSPADRVFVISTATFVNAAPIAQAGPDQYVTAGQGVTLSGTGSFDPDTQVAPLTYRWIMRSAPLGSTAELSNPTSPAPSFYLDLEGRYEFELVVFDGATLSAPDRVVVATNHLPIARAGEDQERAVGATARLSGHGSTDEDGQRLTYQWTLISRPPASTAALLNATSVLPTLTLDQPGSYVVRLIVHDGIDPSEPDTVTIATGDLPPVANPGPSRAAPGSTPTDGALTDDRPVITAAVGQTVHLDGTASFDPNFQGGPTMTYQWTLTLRPAGSAAVLTGPTSARPTFVADVAGNYVARLVVTSAGVSSPPREIRIATGNSRPVADAGAAQTVAAGSTVTLDGTGSTDINGDPLSYQWTFLTTPAGSAAAISGDTSPRAAFIADVPGVYVAQVLVNDGGFVDAAAVLITTNNVAPIGRAGADQAVPAPSAVTLDGNASTDANFDPLTYRWVLTRRPASSSALLSNPASVVPGFSVDQPGDYVAQLRVSDGDRYGAIDTVLITTGNAAPLANPGFPQNVVVAEVVSLDGTNSSDANGTPLTYAWSILYRPSGSTATLSNPAAAEPTFVADLPGFYVAQLIVSDGTLRSAPATVVITTVAAPIAVAVAPDTAFTGASVPLDGSASHDPQLLPLTYLWSFASRPVGSLASIENPLAAITAFTPDLAGAYVVCLVVNNGTVPSTSDCETIVVSAAPALTLSPSVLNLALNETASMTVTLNQPAGPSGVVVALAASGTAPVAVPPSVTIPAGQAAATFDVQSGATDGTATIAATAAGYAGDLAHVNVSVSGITITLGAGLVVAPQQIRDLSLTLSEPAPAGGVLVTLTSSNPAVAIVTPSIFVPEGADVPMTNPQVTGLAYGMTEISASATDLAGDTEVVAVARSISLTPSTLNLVVGGSGVLLLQASAPAPGGGLGFNVTVETGGVVAAASTVTIAANFSSTFIFLTGQALGTTVVTVTPTDAGDTSTASATVTVSNPQPINLQGIAVGKNLLGAGLGSLGSPAPAGGRQVTITSTDPSRVLLSLAASDFGAASIVLTVAAGTTQLPPFYAHGLADSGVVLLDATSPGLPDAQATVTLAPSGFRLAAGNFITGLFSPVTLLPIQAVRLDPLTLMPIESQMLRRGVTVSVPVTSSSPAVATVTSPVGFTGPAGGSFSIFDPIAAGTTRIGIGTPAGFATPAIGAEITATVAAPLNFSPASLTVGRNLQASASLTLGSPAPAGNLPVVITSADPAKVLLSKTAAGAGSASISFIVGAGSTDTPQFFVQALDESGTFAVNATAANYDAGSLPVTLTPSGVVFLTDAFTTHPAAPNTTLTLATVRLEPGTFAYVVGPGCPSCQAVRGGFASFDVTVSSSDNPTGSVTGPATFTAGSATATASFDPHVAGTVTLTIVTPASFSTPANGTAIQATVTAANATLSAGGLLLGKNLQSSHAVSLGEPAPAGNLLVTIQSSDPSRVLLSTSPTSPGMDTITVTAAAGQSGTPTFYVHAFGDSGSVAVNLAAPGYVSGSFDVALRPSGFVFRTDSFSTSTLSPNTPLEIRAVWLDEGTLAYAVDPFCTRCQPLATGVTAEVTVTSAPTTVGTITISPVMITPTTSGAVTAFHPLSGGTATLSLGTPPGFSTPSNFREITATVGNPPLSIADITVGKHLQAGTRVALGAPAGVAAVPVTISTSDPNLLLSTNPASAGTASIVVDVGPGSTHSPIFYVQALTDTGTAQISATASGYSPTIGNVTFRPSGFVFVSTNFVTGALLPNTTLTLRSVWLDPVSLTWASDPQCTSCQAVRGGFGPVPVAIASSNPAVGATTGPAIFSGGDFTATTAFDPVSNGITTLTIEPPDEFSASGNFSSIVATVQPALQLGAAIVGRNLQAPAGGFMTAPAPLGGLLITLQSSDPAKLLLASSPTAPGQASITLSLPVGAGSFAYYAQALTATGAAQVTATAAGYTDGQATITFAPAGFVLDASDFTVSPSAPNVPLTIRSVRLDPDFLTYLPDPSCTMCQALRPGLDLTVDVTSSNPAIGSIVGTAQFTGGVGTVQVQFDPHAVGTTTVALGPAPETFATPSNFQFIEVTVATPPPSLTIPATTLGKNLQVPIAGSLGAPAPAGNLDVTITSADPDKVLLSASPGTVGASSVTISVPAGSMTMPVFYAQALSDTGSVQLTASATGYLTGGSPVTLWPSGFVIETPNFTTSPTAVPHAIQVRSVRIDPTFLNYIPDPLCTSCQNVRAGFTVDVPVVSADPGIGTITLSPLTFTSNDGLKSTAFDGHAPGTVPVSLTTPDGFATPSNQQSIDVTVTNSFIAIPPVTVGKNLQTEVSGGSLGEPAPAGNLTVTVSADPAKVLLSHAPSVPGTGSITITVPAGSTALPTFHVQAVDSTGLVPLDVSAPGYVGNPVSVTLVPSGFAFMIPSTFTAENDDFTTGSLSPDKPLTIHPVRLDPATLNVPAPVAFLYCFTICQPLRPGIIASVAVTSSNPAAGAITNSPLTFDHTAVSGLNAIFDPIADGSTTVTIAAPAGFSQPTNRGSLVATVTPPALTMQPRSIGRNLQAPVSVNLPAAAPPGNLVVTITSSDPSKVLLSASGGAGSPSITVTVPAGQTSSPAFYVQALADTGAIDITASAAGYASGTTPMTLHPSGFVLTHVYWCFGCFGQDIQTTAGAANTSLFLVSTRLNPATLNPEESQTVRGGLSVDVTVSTTPAGVGTMVPTPVTVTGGTAFESGVVTIAFNPAAAGTTLLEVVTPTGFSPSSSFRTMQATVTNAALSLPDQSIGKNLQVQVSVALGEPAPAGGVDVTVTSADASKLIVSADPAAPGAVSAVVHAAPGQTSVTVYAQALSDTGSVALTATASGLSPGTGTMTLAPAGFVITQLYWCITCFGQTFSTTTGAANTQLYVVAGRLNAGTGNFEISQNVRGGLSVDVTVSSTATVGTNVMAVVPPTVTFTGGIAFGSSVASIEADPMNAGTAVLEVVTPTGFAASNDRRQMTATVTGPVLSLGDAGIGKDLQSAVNVNLQEPAPPGGVDVTLQSADMSKVLVSDTATTAGGVSASVHVPAGASSATFYVQSLASSGTVALTATAPGFTAGGSNAVLQPSGFIITQLSWCITCFGVTFNTTTGSPNTPLDVVSVRLQPGTLAFDLAQPVRGGLTVNVNLQSADSSGTNVGTLTPATATFTGGVSVVATAFDPANPGVAILEPVPPAGFSSPSTFRQLTANVSAPTVGLAVNIVGKDLQTTAGGTLGAPAPAGPDLLVTITSTEPGRLRVAAAPTDVGGTSIVLSVPAGTSNLPTFYLQALDGSGSAELTATATGYATGTAAVPLAPSGFVSLTPGGNFTTTTLAAPTSIAVYSAALSPALAYLAAQPVRPGVTVQVSVTAQDSTGTGVGTIVGSPVEFTGNQGIQPVAFDPAALGSSIITIAPPAGFSTPANFRVFTATVNAPAMFLGDTLLGKDLQTAMSGVLGDTSPSDVTLTITSTDASKVLLSALPTTAGTSSIVITSPGPTNVIPAFYVQGLTDSGTARLNVSAPGFMPTSAQVTLTPSGFIISSPSSFTTQGNAANTEFQIASARLAPGILTYQVGQPLRPGATASVAVTSTVPSVGAITLSPVAFSGNQGVRSTFFDPQPVATDGTTTVQISTPAGYATPTQYQTVDVTVQAVPIDPTATSNYAQWLLGGAASPAVVNFDAYATGTILTGSEYGTSGLTIVQRDGHPMRVASAGDGSFLRPANVNSPTRGLTSSGVAAGFDGTKSENYDFVFAHTVMSAGLWIGSLDPGGPDVVVQFLDSTETVIQSYVANRLDANLVQGPVDGFDNRLFVGLNASVPISRIRVISAAGDTEGIVFDDITFTRAATTVIDFEDQPDNIVKTAFPASYRGITWTNFFHYAPYPSPYQTGGVNAIFGASDGARFTFPEQVFTGADFSRDPSFTGDIYFELYQNGVLVHTSAPFAGGAARAFLASGYGGPVDEVRVRSLGSAMTPAGGAWVMDNVSFIQTTPAGPLFLTPPSRSQALGSTQSMTVSILNPLSFDLTVSLTSSDVPVATVPSSVVIPAGSTSAVFDVTASNVGGGTLITASSPDASPARAVVAVSSGLVEWVSNTSGNWSQGSNWSTGLVPSGGDVVYINRPGTVTVTIDTASAIARTIYSTEPIHIAGVLNVQDSAAFDGGFTLVGMLGGSGKGTARGPLNWTSGSLAMLGGLDIEAGQTLTIGTSTDHHLQGSSLRNRGTVVFSGGNLHVVGSSTILNEAGALWQVQGDRTIASNFSVAGNTFTNAGTLRKASGTGTLTFGGGLISIFNTGTMEIQSGTINAAGSAFNSSGHIAVSAGVSLNLANVTLQPGSTFSGAGVLHVNGVTTVTGNLTVPVALELSGTLTGPGQITMTAAMNWPNGVVTLAGGLDIEAGRTLTIVNATDHHLQQGSSLRNRGTVIFSGGNLHVTAASTVLNATGALWEVQGDRTIASNFSVAGNTFTNAGTLRKTSGPGPLTFGGGLLTVNNTGTMEVQSGTINAAGSAFNSSGHIDVSAGVSLNLSNVTLQPGSTFSGAGTLSVPGTTTVNGNFTVPVALELSGTLTGPGRITMTAPMSWTNGVVSLAGGLDIDAGQTLTIGSPTDHHLQGSSLRNRGTVIVSGGNLHVTGTSTVLNAADALWEVQGDRQIASNFSVAGNTFTNAGTLRKTSGSGALTFGGGLISIINTGTMEIQSGTINAAGTAFNSSGHLSVGAGVSLNLANVTLETGSTFSGAGLLHVNGSTTVTGNLTVPVALELSGTLTGPGQITMTAPMNWPNGVVTLAGGLDIEAGQTLTISNATDHHLQGSSLRNRGIVIFSGGNLHVTGASTVLNDVGAIWDAQGSRQIASNFSVAGNTFTNAGTLRNSGGIGTLTIGGGLISFTNTGTISQRITDAATFDRIHVTGQFNFGGTLRVFLVAGFVPAVTDVFTTHTFGSRTGTYAVIDGNGHTWVPCYTATQLSLGDPGNGAFCAGP